MGLVGRILSYVGRTAKINSGGGYTLTANTFSAAGIDSAPIAGDYCATIQSRGASAHVVAGIVDHVNNSQAGAGEIRVYSRDSTGVIIADIWLKNNGAIEINSTGPLNINGIIISKDGGIRLPAGQSITADSIIANGLELAGHTHGGVTVGGGATGPNI